MLRVIVAQLLLINFMFQTVVPLKRENSIDNNVFFDDDDIRILQRPVDPREPHGIVLLTLLQDYSNQDLQFYDRSDQHSQLTKDKHDKFNVVDYRISDASTNGQLYNIQGIPGIPGKDYPNLSEIPKTSFSCNGFENPGYYADYETGCQVWHYCQSDKRQDKFLCPNGTIFNQNTRICDWWFNVRCESISARRLNERTLFIDAHNNKRKHEFPNAALNNEIESTDFSKDLKFNFRELLRSIKNREEKDSEKNAYPISQFRKENIDSRSDRETQEFNENMDAIDDYPDYGRNGVTDVNNANEENAFYRREVSYPFLDGGDDDQLHEQMKHSVSGSSESEEERFSPPYTFTNEAIKKNSVYTRNENDANMITLLNGNNNYYSVKSRRSNKDNRNQKSKVDSGLIYDNGIIKSYEDIYFSTPKSETRNENDDTPQIKAPFHNLKRLLRFSRKNPYFEETDLNYVSS
ncbi:uncharacterized protein B4U80_04806 [Leptotrombidium deliense]|uniref:Chitin-binding type-2 domain-containing protein n=1 Tax=Leptotrombidium deliense TaxID=299467 RepID=A0A443SAT7_9ACAR|nr:uncharacterized protein B4U80_04806 [Leptotrombidium deliense]